MNDLKHFFKTETDDQALRLAGSLISKLGVGWEWTELVALDTKQPSGTRSVLST